VYHRVIERERVVLNYLKENGIYYNIIYIDFFLATFFLSLSLSLVEMYRVVLWFCCGERKRERERERERMKIEYRFVDV